MLTAFLLASLVLAVTPGPGVVYVVTRTLAQGRAAWLASVLGVAIGNLGNALSAALGLAALFAVSALAFELVTLAGAAYLLWLGWRTLRAPVADGAGVALPATAPLVTRQVLRDVFRDGFVVALLNPKTTLFFAAFLPQFIEPAGASPMAQTLLLGGLFVLIAACTDGAYVLAAGRVAPWLARHRTRSGAAGRWIGAAIYVSLGLYAVIAGLRLRR